MTYHTLHQMYGADNIKHLGNHVLVIDRRYRQAIGYTIKSYDGYTPDVLTDKVYTDISNTGGTWDGAYDMLYGTPTAPDFTRVLNS